MEKDPDLRYQTAADLRSDLKRLHRDTSSAHTVAQATAIAPATNKKPFLRWAIVIAILVIAGIAAWFAFTRAKYSAALPAPGPAATAPSEPETGNTSSPVPPEPIPAEPVPPAAHSDENKKSIPAAVAKQPSKQSASAKPAQTPAVKDSSPAPPPTPASSSAATTNSSVLSPTTRPCEQITHACEAAGFVYGNAKAGNGISADCIVPIIQGTPQPRKASRPLPQIDPQTIAVCKERSPNYGKPRNNAGSQANNVRRLNLSR